MTKTKSGLLWTDLNEVVVNLVDLRLDVVSAKFGLHINEELTIGLKMPTENSQTPGEQQGKSKQNTQASSELKHRIVLRKLENMGDVTTKEKLENRNEKDIEATFQAAQLLISKGKVNDYAKIQLFDELPQQEKTQFLIHLQDISQSVNDATLKLYQLCLNADSTFAGLKNVIDLRTKQEETTEVSHIGNSFIVISMFLVCVFLCLVL